MPASTKVLSHCANMALSGEPRAFSNGRVGGGGGGGNDGPRRAGVKAPMKHIQDITSAMPSLDARSPIERLLQAAEQSMRQAETFKSFGRPDFALEEYIKAFTIATKMIPENKGMSSLRDNKAQNERYQRLFRGIKARVDDFERIKTVIKADNEKSGVQPTLQRSEADGTVISSTRSSENHGNEVQNGKAVIGENARSAGTADGDLVENRTAGQSAPTPPRVKPAIHPKPHGLSGNVLNSKPQQMAGSSQLAQDLARRFSKLSSSTSINRSNSTLALSAGVQDPRIRTRQIAGLDNTPTASPRPSQERPEPKLITALPDLPKMPDAIYSPARGTITSEAAALPSSTSRGMFSRTNSTTSFTSMSKNNAKSPPLPSGDTFSPLPGPAQTSLNQDSRRSLVHEGEVITVSDLVCYMGLGSKEIQILLIDVRSRQEFDEGHIMSQATICIEPEILQRHDISADQIIDSMVLAPTQEQLLFERRHEFDLVVFYDEKSFDVPETPRTQQDTALANLKIALELYDESPNGQNRRPKLLQGGLIAWGQQMGMNSLQVTNTADVHPNGGQAMTRKTQRGRQRTSGMAQALLQVNRRQHQTRPIQDPEEVRRWEETMGDADAFSPVSTMDEFLRRYPAVNEQESMVSALPRSMPPSVSAQVPAQQAERLFSSIPAPPTRPAPALPRPSFSGLADTHSADSTAVTKVTTNWQSSDDISKRTGLVNPHNLCYANSSLQAIFATPFVSGELTSGDWAVKYRVPKKPEEKMDNPQLLCKMLHSLFSILSTREHGAVRAAVLMAYIKHIHKKTEFGSRGEDYQFGGKRQHDAHEFFSFIIDTIHDETNVCRDVDDTHRRRVYEGKREHVGPVMQNALDYWSDYEKANQSLVDRYFRFLTVTYGRCVGCGWETRNCVDNLFLQLHLDRSGRLENMVRTWAKQESKGDLRCPQCPKLGQLRQSRVTRLPECLMIQLVRMGPLRDDGTSPKLSEMVYFPLTGLRLTDCFLPREECEEVASRIEEDVHYDAEADYDLYAVIHHLGLSLLGGHYVSFVKDNSSRDGADWWKIDDSQATKLRVGMGDSKDDVDRLYGDKHGQAYMLFYRRRQKK